MGFPSGHKGATKPMMEARAHVGLQFVLGASSESRQASGRAGSDAEGLVKRAARGECGFRKFWNRFSGNSGTATIVRQVGIENERQ
jgi:hypothetical protein